MVAAATRRGADSREADEDLRPLGAFSIGIGGIVVGGIFATLGLAGSQARRATWLSFLVGGAVAPLLYQLVFRAVARGRAGA